MQQINILITGLQWRYLVYDMNVVCKQIHRFIARLEKIGRYSECIKEDYIIGLLNLNLIDKVSKFAAN